MRVATKIIGAESLMPSSDDDMKQLITNYVGCAPLDPSSLSARTCDTIFPTATSSPLKTTHPSKKTHRLVSSSIAHVVTRQCLHLMCRSRVSWIVAMRRYILVGEVCVVWIMQV